MSPIRLHIIVLILAIGLAALFARAVQVQVLQKEKWDEKVRERNIDDQQLQTSRGRILDVKGREMATNAACIDAVLDYRAIRRPADEKWVKDHARGRLLRRLGDTYRNAPLSQRKPLLEAEIAQVNADIEQMWHDLGDKTLTGYTPEQVEDRRLQIVRKVQMLRRHLWYSRYVQASEKQDQQQTAWWYRWLNEDQNADLDTFDVSIKEQSESHIILPAISGELANHLGKNLDRYPGLSLRPGEQRVYPMKDIAPHVLGYLGPASQEDLERDPNRTDPLRKYLPGEYVGRAGVENLCEELLRGARGRERRDHDTGKAIESVPAQAGKDITLTIDAALQRKVEQAFASPKVWKDRKLQPEADPFYGAAVVIDIPTNEVRAMVSYPTYDLNDLDKSYAAMVQDDVNRKLLNRATLAQREPGSTVKPLAGIAAITEGVVGLHERIECTGRLILDGRSQHFGRCWTVKLAMSRGLPEPYRAHHMLPAGAPHPTGFLEFQDALERSCNVWCEVAADRLGARLPDWYERFGLGRPTGIGLPEGSGMLPISNSGPAVIRRRRICLAGIGQQDVWATPVQMANVAALIARDGVWMRPKLVTGGFVPPGVDGPEQVRLPVDPGAMRAAREGMRLVVSSIAGSGNVMQMPGIAVAGKTGTAQAARLRVAARDERGNMIDEQGNVVTDPKKAKKVWLEYSMKGRRNPQAPWYRAGGDAGDEVMHAWFIGFAPFENPKIAFAVMVEYGGEGGGQAAGPIARTILEAAGEEGYLPSAMVKP